MPIDIRWYNEAQNIIYIHYQGQWTLEDFHKMLDKSYELTYASAPFVAVGDFTDSSMLPSGLLSTGRRVEQTTPSHRLMLILIQPNSLLLMLMKVVSKIYPKAFDNAVIVSTLQDALEQAQTKLQAQES
jgi:hypothetical protein